MGTQLNPKARKAYVTSQLIGLSWSHHHPEHIFVMITARNQGDSRRGEAQIAVALRHQDPDEEINEPMVIRMDRQSRGSSPGWLIRVDVGHLVTVEEFDIVWKSASEHGVIASFDASATP